MKVGEIVYCYNTKYKHRFGKVRYQHLNGYKLYQKYRIYDIQESKTSINIVIQLDQEYFYAMNYFPIRKHGCKKKDIFGNIIPYFDKFFLTEKQYRKYKLLKIKKLENI
jgi:hypothetical protein